MSGSSYWQSESDPVDDRVVAYLLQSLSTEERQNFERQLQVDPILQQRLKDHESSLALLAYAAPPAKAPSALQQRIMQQATVSKKRDRWSWPSWAIALLGLGAVLLGADNVRLRYRIAQEENHAAPETYLFQLRGTTTALDAAGGVLLNVESAQGLLTLINLPPLATGEAYYLWAFTETETILCGRFTAVSNGQLSQKFPIPIEEYGDEIVKMQLSRETLPVPKSKPLKEPIMTSQI